MRSLTVPEWGDVLSGEPVLETHTLPYRPVPADMGRWLEYMDMSPTARTVLDATESVAEFFNIEKDLALLVPKKEWAEFFFSVKNGFVAPNCPAQFIYFARTIYNQHRICNLIGVMLPKEVAFYVGKHDYFGAGYTARDAICNFVNPQFQPITPSRLLVRCGDWYEAYIPSTGMVAALPPAVGKLLSPDDLYSVKLTMGLGLTLGGHTLRSLASLGEVPSVYDLRDPVSPRT